MYPVRPYFPRSEGEAHARRGHTPRTEGDVEVAATSGTQAAEVPFKMEHRSEGQTFLDGHDTPAGRGGQLQQRSNQHCPSYRVDDGDFERHVRQAIDTHGEIVVFTVVGKLVQVFVPQKSTLEVTTRHNDGFAILSHLSKFYNIPPEVRLGMLQHEYRASNARSSQFATPSGMRSASPGAKAVSAKEGVKEEDGGRAITRSPKHCTATPVSAATAVAVIEPPAQSASQRFRISEPAHRPHAPFVREWVLRSVPEKYQTQGRWKY